MKDRGPERADLFRGELAPVRAQIFVWAFLMQDAAAVVREANDRDIGKLRDLVGFARARSAPAAEIERAEEAALAWDKPLRWEVSVPTGFGAADRTTLRLWTFRVDWAEEAWVRFYLCRRSQVRIEANGVTLAPSPHEAKSITDARSVAQSMLWAAATKLFERRAG